MNIMAGTNWQHNYLNLIFILALLVNPVKAQILKQDFNQLNSLTEFRGNPPSQWQVDRINLNPVNSDGEMVFRLGEEAGNKFLQVHKRGNKLRHFDRVTGINNAPFLQLIFDFSVDSSNNSKKFATFFIGDSLTNNSQNPGVHERWAQIGIFIDADSKYYFTNELYGNSVLQRSGTIDGKHRISSFMNNSGGLVNYVAPDGTNALLPDKYMDLWIGEDLAIHDLVYNGNSSFINAVKFLLSGTDQHSTARIDNLVIRTDFGIDPLPVELVNFSVKQLAKDIKLSWQTASEKNNTHFEIERSLDGKTFIPIGQVLSAGNGSQLQRYLYIDQHAAREFAGTVYYRLKIVDVDDTYEYSAIVPVTLPGRSFQLYSIFPNPFQDRLLLEIQAIGAQLVEVDLLDQQGVLLLRQQEQLQPGVPELSIQELERFPPGIYFLRIKTAGFQGHYRLVKL